MSAGASKDALTTDFNLGQPVSELSSDTLTTFKVEKTQKIVIFVLPVANIADTLIEFEYEGIGTEYEWYEGWYYRFFTGDSDKEELFIYVACAAGLLCCLLLCCLAFCCYRCCRKQEQDQDAL